MAYPAMNKSYQQLRWNLSACSDRRKSGAVRYIVIHYTGTTATAENNCKYFSGGNRYASADFFIGTGGVIWKYNANLGTRYSWHCGDGNGLYGITNYNSIGIEVVSAGKEYTTAQKESLRKLVRALMEDFNVPASRVVRHYDASRKTCPAPYAGTSAKNKKWNTLHDFITTKSAAANKKDTAKTTSIKAEAAQNFSKSFAHTYKVNSKDGLKIRSGAGTDKTIIKSVPNGKQVVCYGYYNVTKAKVKWYLVEYTVDGKSYTGYMSSKFLKKVK